jgi:hypothetical protein
MPGLWVERGGSQIQSGDGLGRTEYSLLCHALRLPSYRRVAAVKDGQRVFGLVMGHLPWPALLSMSHST